MQRLEEKVFESGSGNTKVIMVSEDAETVALAVELGRQAATRFSQN
jgi:hypothetical protein